MADKGNKSEATLRLIFGIIVLVCTLFGYGFANRSCDPNILYVHLIGLGFLAIDIVVIFGFALREYLKDNNKNKTSSVLYLILLVAFVVFVGFGLYEFSRTVVDLHSEPAQIKMINCSKKVTRSGGKYKSTHYKVTGYVNGEQQTLDVTGIDKETWNAIGSDGDEIKIVYYPRTKLIKSLEIYEGLKIDYQIHMPEIKVIDY